MLFTQHDCRIVGESLPPCWRYIAHQKVVGGGPKKEEISRQGWLRHGGALLAQTSACNDIHGDGVSIIDGSFAGAGVRPLYTLPPAPPAALRTIIPKPPSDIGGCCISWPLRISCPEFFDSRMGENEFGTVTSSTKEIVIQHVARCFMVADATLPRRAGFVTPPAKQRAFWAEIMMKLPVRSDFWRLRRG